MSTSDIPELEPLEELAPPPPPPVAPAAGAAMGVTPVSLSGLPAPVFSMRAQKEYYRFFFAGLVMLLGCLMPWGPEWQMAGWQTLKGGFFTLIALGIMWSSWVAIAHNRFDLSTMRWLFLAAIPLFATIWHMVTIFEASAVQDYLKAQVALFDKANAALMANSEPPFTEHFHVTSWETFFRNLAGIRTAEYSRSLSDFIRAAGAGQFMLLFGSLMAELFLIKGILTGVKAGAAQKKEQAAARDAGGKSAGRSRRR